MLEQMQKYLAQVQKETPLNKIMVAILDIQNQIDNINKEVGINRGKIIEIVDFINGKVPSKANQDAEALNHDVQEDNPQPEIIE